MIQATPERVTGLLLAWSDGDQAALEKLIPLVYAARKVAEVLKVSPRTVRQDWSLARAWLYRELSLGGGGDS
jgi:hypothetical protein